uniref:pentatricopeptide repeat-containing protein At3g47530 n=1 Tax=Erigeron canadensis TaxID=72917 RepID=UPI001CB8E00B|nr:pentatricopeptide repeat-containing protein At3g47530 [Erigeron canadensis]
MKPISSNSPFVSHFTNQPHLESLISLINKSTNQTTQLHQIHAHLIRTSLLQQSTFSIPFLKKSTTIFQNLKYSLQIFSQILKPNVTHYNTIIQAHSISLHPERGFYVYRDMLRKNVHPNPLSSSFVVKACVKGCLVFCVLQVHGRVLRDGCFDTVLMTNLMEFYSGCGNCGDACKVFDEMPVRDVVAWNVLVSCYVKNNRTRDALGVFDLMQSKGNACDPDDVTCLMLLQACGHLCALGFGERVHGYVRECGYDRAVNVCNSLVAMYSKCGQLDKAYEVFKGIPYKDVVSWTAMISGFASNGCGREAIDVFGEMERAGVKPDEQTFTALLSGCSHSGLLDEGRVIFDCMKDFGVVPNIHHYGCVVDLMGRVGLVEDAYELIFSMRCKPDPTIWRTLLGACKVNGHVTLGERVIGHLIELKAQEAGDYILLLNIYSSAGNWEKVIELRKLMKEKGIQTTPSTSTIELKGKLHEFRVDDTSHPRINEVYEMLDEIEEQLKIGGYVAEITSEKEVRLSLHSEKLAMAFGVLATPPGTKIRVAKDLRICIDCHNFAKVLSGVYSREVVIRDRTRFHHFREGRCSCNDFW